MRFRDIFRSPPQVEAERWAARMAEIDAGLSPIFERANLDPTRIPSARETLNLTPWEERDYVQARWPDAAQRSLEMIYLDYALKRAIHKEGPSCREQLSYFLNLDPHRIVDSCQAMTGAKFREFILFIQHVESMPGDLESRLSVPVTADRLFCVVPVGYHEIIFNELRHQTTEKIQAHKSALAPYLYRAFLARPNKQWAHFNEAGEIINRSILHWQDPGKHNTDVSVIIEDITSRRAGQPAFWINFSENDTSIQLIAAFFEVDPGQLLTDARAKITRCCAEQALKHPPVRRAGGAGPARGQSPAPGGG